VILAANLRMRFPSGRSRSRIRDLLRLNGEHAWPSPAWHSCHTGSASTMNVRIQRIRLTNHFALVADAALAFVGEALYAGENRIGIEMRFFDHFQLEPTASPGIVEVGGE
jgi:hypothetical protein